VNALSSGGNCVQCWRPTKERLSGKDSASKNRLDYGGPRKTSVSRTLISPVDWFEMASNPDLHEVSAGWFERYIGPSGQAFLITAIPGGVDLSEMRLFEICPPESLTRD